VIIISDVRLMSEENEGTYIEGGGGQLVRPVGGVGIIFRRPDIGFILSNSAVVYVGKKKNL